jgi:tape measure domain-containing protein
MAEVADRVIVEVLSRVDKAEADIQRYGRSFDRTMTGIGKSASRTAQLVSVGTKAIAGAFAGVSLAAIAAGMVDMADRSKQLEAQLRLATRETGNFGKAQQDVERISASTRSGLEATATLYAAFVRNSGQLGATQDEAARATETFAKVLKIGGANAAEASSATLQFGQALASGALRGDEFNSIAEASQRILKLIAEAMNQPIGALRGLAEEGKITSDVLFKALTNTKFTDGIDAEFKELPVTFGEAMQRLEDSALQTFGAFDRGGQFSTMLANFVSDGAKGFGDLGEEAEKLGIEIRSQFEGLATAFGPLVSAGFAAFSQIDQRAGQTVDYVRDSLNLLDQLSSFGAGVLNRLPQAPGYNTQASGSDLAGRYDRGNASARRRLEGEAMDRMLSNRFGFGPGGVAGFAKGGLAGVRPVARPVPSGAKKGGGKGRAPKSPLDADAFDREEAGLNDAILRAKADQAISAASRAEIELKRIESTRVQAAEEINADKRFTEDQKKRLVALADSLASLETVAVNDRERRRQSAEALEVEADGHRRQTDLLQSQLGLAKTAKDRRDLELRILDSQYKEEEARLRALEASEDLAVATRARADREALEGRKAGDTAGVMDRTQGPLGQYLSSIPRTAAEIDEALEAVAVGGLRDVEDGFARATTKALGLKGALGSVVEQLIEMVLQQQIFNALSGGGGGILGTIGKALGIASGAVSGGAGLSGFGKSAINIPKPPGARALGGPVSAGGAYMVGEQGPELLRMGSQSGFVLPNHKLSKAGGQTTVLQPIHFDLRGAVMTADLIKQMNHIATQSATSAAMAGGALGEQRVMGRGRRRIPG